METATNVWLKSPLEYDLVSASRRRLPYESCGVIYGTAEANGTVVANGFSLIRNSSPSPVDTFSFHPEDWISVFFEAQKNQRNIVGLFHTHPQGSTIPSVGDDLGFLPWGTYWIVSLARHDHGIAIYRRDSRGRWVNLPIKREL